ncbi:hypothetical protein CYMTET_16288 [Cymbomonas tetramitiformis]|uniref:Uncharacterized protein n=1 Tax=Cymbomonas tetramitiformis TaxID=36881 RepID=A0AAE0GCP6_9CHLO|nr:hypothetical protein CYMTET_16288 [Cymbomonas tetramitiformis]
MPTSKKRKVNAELMQRINAAKWGTPVVDSQAADTTTDPPPTHVALPSPPEENQHTPDLLDGRPVISSPIRPISADLAAAASSAEAVGTTERSPAIAAKVAAGKLRRSLHVRLRRPTVSRQVRWFFTIPLSHLSTLNHGVDHC